jgi:two-component system, OmpR family, sensor histidine kinase ChvG
MARRGWRTILRKAPSRIAVRLLAFNVLLAFLPFAGLLYLDTYERHLLEAQERAMVDQARILAGIAAALPGLEVGSLDGVFAAAGGPGDARLRVVAGDGRVLGDSHRAVAGVPAVPAKRTPSTHARETLAYRLGRSLYDGGRWAIALVHPSRTSLARSKEPSDWLAAPEVRAAFAGRYGSATRATPGGQRSLTLYSAVPVTRAGKPEAVVLVSQSTYRLLQALYDVRLRIFEIVLLSAVVAGFLSLIVSATIVRPLRALRTEAATVVARRGGFARKFRGARRRDEIGDLARALEDLTRRVEEHVGFVESFAADRSHEFKNPLASIRTVADTLPLVEDEAERERFLEMLNRDVRRLERLLAGVTDLVHVGVQLEREPSARTDLVPVVRALVDAHRVRAGRDITIELTGVSEATVSARADHLEQVVDNLLDNAAGFSPDAGVIRVSVERDGEWSVLTVRDQGPGVPDAHRDRVFDRFFSYRPGQDQPGPRHTGLGLPIVRTIVEGCGGSVRLEDAPGGGACARVRLPHF